jgi:hypothetical protein
MLVIILLNFVIYQPKNIEANVVATAFVRVAAGSVGERVIVGMAEKAGIKYATKTARKKAVERWNLDVYNKIQEMNKFGKEMEAQELARFQKQLAEATPTNLSPVASKPNFSNFVVSSALFLTGLDLIMDGYHAIKEHAETNKMMESMEELSEAIQSGKSVVSFGGYKAYPFIYNGVNTYVRFGIPSNFMAVTQAGADLSKPFWAEIYKITNNYPNLTYSIEFHINYWTTSGTFRTLYNNGPMSIPISTLEDYRTVSSIPSTTQIPEVQPLPWRESYETSQVVPTTMPDSINVNIPTTNDYPEEVTTPWNEPETFRQPEPDVPPPDGEDPPTDGEDPTKTKIDWSKLKMTAATLTTVFPFSIPWDVGRLISVLDVPPKTPIFNIDTGTTIKLGGKDIPVNFKFDIDFTFLDTIAAIVRWGFILIFDITIIMALRRLTPD